MAAVWMQWRADIRHRLLDLIGLMLLVGIAGAAVMTASAGARRTDTTLARVVRAQRIPDLDANPDNSDGSAAFNRAFSAIDRLPAVATAVTLNGVGAIAPSADGKFDLDHPQNEIDLVAAGTPIFQTIDRAAVVSGRLADPARADEIVINAAKAKASHLRVGDTVRLGIFLQASPAVRKPKLFVDDRFRVTGIVRSLDDASRASDDPYLLPTVIFTPALNRRLAAGVPAYVGKEIALKGGERDVAAFEGGVQKLFAGVRVEDSNGEHAPVNMNFQEPARLTVARAQRAQRPYVFALWLFAALAAIASLAVIGQAIVRSMRPLREDRGILRAVGFTRTQLVQCAVLRGLVVGVAGAAIAVVGAYLASPLMPIGPLRDIEPDRGLRFDAVVLGLGAVVLVVGIALFAVLAMRPRGRATPRAAAAVGDQLARSGTPVPIVSGVRFALDRGRDSSVPVGSTLVGIIVAVAALVATIVYGAGLSRFIDTPTRYGWPWHYDVTFDDQSFSPAQAVARLDRARDISGWAAGNYSQFVIGGKSIAAVGIDAKPGAPFLPLLAGDQPRADDEIVLGEKTMSALGKRLGDTIRVDAQGATKPFRIVGTAVFPRFAPYQGSEPTGLGIGAATTARAIDRLGAANGQQFFLVQTRKGVTADGLARELGRADPSDPSIEVLGPQRPNDVMSYDHLSTTPLLLAGVLVLLAIGSAIHVLVTGVRSRRRDLAVLKTMGTSRGQVREAVLVQATVLVGLALIPAVPLGVVAGRWLWTITAHWLGIAPDPALPLTALGVIIAASFLIANLIAFFPASSAARVRPAVALRTE